MINKHYKLYHCPQPLEVLHLLGLKPDRCNPKGYWTLRCPIHREKQNHRPSLNIHSKNGYYRCHACGFKGSNVVEFYKNVTGKTYAMAIKELFFEESK